MREGDERSRRDRLRPRARGRPRAAARLAGRGRPRRPRRATSLLAWLQADDFSPRRPVPPRPPRARAQARRARSPRRSGAAEGRGDLGAGAARPVRRLRRRDPLRAGRGLPGPREGQAGAPARASRRASRWSPTGSAACTASRTRSRRSASAACPGFDVEVIGTDPNVDRRLSAVAEVDIPFYAGLKIGVPALPAVVEALADGRYDLVHLCSPGPAGIAAALVARVDGAAGRRQLPHRAGGLRGRAHRRPALEAGHDDGARPPSTGSADHVLSPSAASDAAPGAAGHRRRRDRPLGPRRRPRAASRPTAARRRRRFAARPRSTSSTPAARPARRAPTCWPTRSSPPAAGPAPAPGAGRRRPRGAACCASASARTRRSWAGWRATSWRRAYASADVFLFASRTDTFGQVMLEAQASGLPVVAVAEGGPRSTHRATA